MKWARLILLILLIIYIVFIYGDVFAHFSSTYLNIIKYIGIILCFILTLITNCKEYLSDARLLQMGMLFTTFADLALVIFDSQLIGVILFTIVQLFYIARYTRDSFRNIFKRLLMIFIIIFGIYLFISKFIFKTSFILIAAGLFYAICLIVSVVKGLEISRDSSYLNPNKYFIAMGMILFFLCDMSIAIAYILRTYSILNLSYLFSNLIWIFYLPSQTLLAISGYEKM